jgi:hypothetical protein
VRESQRMTELVDGNILKDCLVVEHGGVELEAAPHIMDLDSDIGGAQSFLQGDERHPDIVDACGAGTPIRKLQTGNSLP